MTSCRMEPPAHCHLSRLHSLTSLQIGDIQSYVSELFLYLDVEAEKQVFLVDNRPWTAESRRPKSVELWQLMVTQSRTSPFANRARSSFYEQYDQGSEKLDKRADINKDIRRRLFETDERRLVKLLRELFQHHLKAVACMQDLSQLLHGCITFEVNWKDVRGINYVNELLTDTYVALETKLLIKRNFSSFREALEFHGIISAPVLDTSKTLPSEASNIKDVQDNQTVGCTETPPISVVGTLGERQFACSQLEVAGLDDGFSREFNDSSWMPNCADSKFVDALQCGCHPDKEHQTQLHKSGWLAANYEQSTCVGTSWPNPELECRFGMDCDYSDNSSACSMMNSEGDEDTYQVFCDTLLVYRFADPTLPFALEKIIMTNQRLLKMLESGLPSWVIFMQSYPVVSRVYRPWMRPFARYIYVLVSIITVVIGFYDLYKNVPVLKAMAARICGPLFEWIEDWEMVSRIKYLLTVIFLQNWEKAFRWLLLLLRTSKQICNMLMMPLVEPLEELLEYILPTWNLLADGVWSLLNLLWMALSLVIEYTSSLIQLAAWPFVVLLSAAWSVAAWLLYLLGSTLWGFITLPLRMVALVVNLVVALLCGLYRITLNIWNILSSSIQIFSATTSSQSVALKAAKTSSSTWKLLWHDIFSQVFRAIRSILNGLIAFFTACNRHRLSIYNNVSDFSFRFVYLLRSAYLQLSDAYHQILNAPLQNEGGFEDELIENRKTD